MSKSTSFASEWLSFCWFWSLRSTKLIGKSVLVFAQMLTESEKMPIFDYTFNSKKACFVALEHTEVNKKWHFFYGFEQGFQK